MKVLIDIPKGDYKLACSHPEALIDCYARYIKAGTPVIEQKGESMDRQEFLDIIYAEFESDPDNVRANRIIEAAEEYVESVCSAVYRMNRLEPCRCGGHPQAVVDDETETKFGVKCFECGASIFPEKKTLEEAVEAWNRVMGVSRIDDVIGNIAYILDTLRAYREIENSGGCNECGKRAACEYAPKLGQLVRYNCPFYERMEGKG